MRDLTFAAQTEALLGQYRALPEIDEFRRQRRALLHRIAVMDVADLIRERSFKRVSRLEYDQ